MPDDKKRGTKKAPVTEEREEIVIDSYERWLSRQPVKHARAKTGYISASEAEANG